MELPLALRESADLVEGLRLSQFDRSYLEFLDEQIRLSPRGPEWTERLKHRLVGLTNSCDVALLDGHVYLVSSNIEYWVKVDPMTDSVVYCEEYLEARSTPKNSA